MAPYQQALQGSKTKELVGGTEEKSVSVICRHWHVLLFQSPSELATNCNCTNCGVCAWSNKLRLVPCSCYVSVYEIKTRHLDARLSQK